MTPLERLRRNANLTQLQLEEMSGVSQTTISAIENGRMNPTAGTLRKLSKALGVTIEKIIGDSEGVKDV